MEDMLFTTAEELCKEHGNMADVVAEYLAGFYKREMEAGKDVNLAAAKT